MNLADFFCYSDPSRRNEKRIPTDPDPQHCFYFNKVQAVPFCLVKQITYLGVFCLSSGGREGLLLENKLSHKK